MILRANQEHIQDLVPLFDAYRVFYKKNSDVEGATLFLKERFENKDSVVFIAYKNNLPVGFTQLYTKFSSGKMIRNWILNDLFVMESNRKQGIGEQLIDAAFSFAKDSGAEFLQLETQIDNLTAQSLYRKVGFQLQDPDEEFILFKKFI